MTEDELWYDRPAGSWLEGLPLGNGRLGVMAHGAIDVEHLQVNDGTAWSGSPDSARRGPLVDAETAAEAIRAARAAVAAEDFAEATRQVQRLQHRHTQSYLPFVDLRVTSSVTGVTSPEVTAYRRSLELASATYSLTYRVAGHEVRRRLFLSHPHDVGVLTIETDHPAGLDLSVAVTSLLRVIDSGASQHELWTTLRLPADVSPPHDELDDPVRYSDESGSSMEGAVALSWTHDGEGVGHSDDALAATGVHEATIVFSTRTTFAGIARRPEGTARDALGTARSRVATAFGDGIGSVRRTQVQDHGSLYDRVHLATGLPRAVHLPTDERIRRGAADPAGALSGDPALAGLLYNYGRYLLISSSRPGGLPANLQGIWNNQLQPPWSANYTTNINLEMNYWSAEVANLSELAGPLFDLIDGLALTGRETAQRLYAAPGWVAHHNTDPWAYPEPVGWGEANPTWACWPLAGAWLVRHLWEHLLFGADDDFVRRAWPPIRSAAQFFLHWLVELPDGSLGTVPSTSPENIFVGPDGSDGSVDASSTMDLVLIADLFGIVVACAERLGLADDEVAVRASAARRLVPGPVVGRHGMIPEWRADRPQGEPLHRHLSHLYFAFPGDLPLTPALHGAVTASMDARGDEATGWSLAWKVALRARLRQPGKVGDLMTLVFRETVIDDDDSSAGLYPNLFASHPPFQIDGNFGFVAALTECLMQSHAGVIELLPAVPRQLPTGSISGIVARPGVEVSVEWGPDASGGVALVAATLTPIRASGRTRHRVVWNGREVTVDLTAGDAVTLRGGDFAGSAAP